MRPFLRLASPCAESVEISQSVALVVAVYTDQPGWQFLQTMEEEKGFGMPHPEFTDVLAKARFFAPGDPQLEDVLAHLHFTDYLAVAQAVTFVGPH